MVGLGSSEKGALKQKATEKLSCANIIRVDPAPILVSRSEPGALAFGVLARLDDGRVSRDIQGDLTAHVRNKFGRANGFG